MRKVPPEVFTGTYPEWKEAWEEGLTLEEQRDVNAAVLRGKRLDDPSLAPFVYGKVALARQALRRTLVWSVPLQAIIFVFLAWRSLSHTGGPPWWAWVLAGIVLAAIWGTVLWIRTSLLRRAERLNSSPEAQHF